MGKYVNVTMMDIDKAIKILEKAVNPKPYNEVITDFLMGFNNTNVHVAPAQCKFVVTTATAPKYIMEALEKTYGITKFSVAPDREYGKKIVFYASLCKVTHKKYNG